MIGILIFMDFQWVREKFFEFLKYDLFNSFFIWIINIPSYTICLEFNNDVKQNVQSDVTYMYLILFQLTCRLVAICLHYFYLASFSWLFVEMLHLYRRLIEIRDINYGTMKFYYLLGYGQLVNHIISVPIFLMKCNKNGPI